MPTDSFWKAAFKCSHLQNKVEGLSVGLRSEGQTDGPSGYIVANLPTSAIEASAPLRPPGIPWALTVCPGAA